MLAAIMTIGFLVAAAFVAVSLKASLAQGWAARAALRRGHAECITSRTVTVRSYATSAPGRAALVSCVSGRPSRRTVAPVLQAKRKRELAAA